MQALREAAIQRFLIEYYVDAIGIQPDLSPEFHPAIGRVLASFDPVRAVGAMGRGAKPHVERSASPHC
jgi:hypothetical protein